MNSITFFLCFIPLLALVLLALNLVFAPHSPYQEKSSTFECGFHSFLGQNRTQFSISFFIFGLLFLLFDLELLVVYPLTTSFYTNGGYGLAIMLVFFLVLTLGFAFELGKKALSIDSRQYNQTSNLKSEVISIKFIFNIILKSSIEYYKQFKLSRIFAILIIGQIVRYILYSRLNINILDHISIEVLWIAGLTFITVYAYYTPLPKFISKLTHRILNGTTILCFTLVMSFIILTLFDIDLFNNTIFVSITTGLFVNSDFDIMFMDGNYGGSSSNFTGNSSNPNNTGPPNQGPNDTGFLAHNSGDDRDNSSSSDSESEIGASPDAIIVPKECVLHFWDERDIIYNHKKLIQEALINADPDFRESLLADLELQKENLKNLVYNKEWSDPKRNDGHYQHGKRTWIKAFLERYGVQIERGAEVGNCNTFHSKMLTKAFKVYFSHHITDEEKSKWPNLFESLKKGDRAFVVKGNKSDSDKETIKNIKDALNILHRHSVLYDFAKAKVDCGVFWRPKSDPNS